jgi:hypothetical protein
MPCVPLFSQSRPSRTVGPTTRPTRPPVCPRTACGRRRYRRADDVLYRVRVLAHKRQCRHVELRLLEFFDSCFCDSCFCLGVGVVDPRHGVVLRQSFVVVMQSSCPARSAHWRPHASLGKATGLGVCQASFTCATTRSTAFTLLACHRDARPDCHRDALVLCLPCRGGGMLPRTRAVYRPRARYRCRSPHYPHPRPP